MKRPRHTDKQYTLSSDFECIKFDHKSYEADITRYIEKIEKELQKIVVMYLYKSEQMDVIESENKKLIESIEMWKKQK